jgi:hypothetical protein
MASVVGERGDRGGDGEPRFVVLPMLKTFAGVAASATLLATTPGDAFRSAREAWPLSAYPPYATYQTVVRYGSGGRAIVRRWDTLEDLRRRMVHAEAFSDRDREAPHVPEGTNVGAYGSLTWNGKGLVLGPKAPAPGKMPPKGIILNRERDEDAIGPVSFAIDQDFGIAFNAPPISALRSAGDVASARSLPHIGGTRTVAPDYDVSRAADESAPDGGVVVHLVLHPKRAPYRYRLRELWIDAAMSHALHAVVQGIGDRPPFDGVRWRIDFRAVDGAVYIERETALADMDHHGAHLTGVSVSFENMQVRSDVPAERRLGLAYTTGIADP